MIDDRLLLFLTANPDADRSAVVDWIRNDDPLLGLDIVDRIASQVADPSPGHGQLGDLLDDPTVNEVMINGPGPVWVDRGQRLESSDVVVDEHDIAVFVERILDPLGLRVDRSSPVVDARLPDGSRVNVVVAPLALDGPIVTVRRFSPRPLGLDAFGGPEVVSIVTELVGARSTILVVGATSAGKTTVLNAVGSLLDPSERVVTIEDTAELRFPGRHVVRLEARPPNSEGVGEVTLRHLVRNALRMRPDRLVIGEVRGPEALDLVLALNTGHRGSLATCHAGDPIGALSRLETLALLGDADLPLGALRAQIAGAIDAVVVVARVGGQRRIVEVATINGAGRPQREWTLAEVTERCPPRP